MAPRGLFSYTILANLQHARRHVNSLSLSWSMQRGRANFERPPYSAEKAYYFFFSIRRSDSEEEEEGLSPLPPRMNCLVKVVNPMSRRRRRRLAASQLRTLLAMGSKGKARTKKRKRKFAKKGVFRTRRGRERDAGGGSRRKVSSFSF